MTTQSKSPGFDLLIRMDSEHKVIGISLNETELSLPLASTTDNFTESCCSTPTTEPAPSVTVTPAAEPDCCSGGASDVPATPELLSGVSEARRVLVRHSVHGLITLSVVLVLHWAVYHFYHQDGAHLPPRLGWWAFYLDLTVVSLVVALGYLRTYRYAAVHHSIAMMIGMTVGMQVGMMTGGVLGATNGFFIGALVGMGLGSSCAVTTAWCCGPMAVTQGLMAGVMGGTMGAMILAMMSHDKVLIFMPVFTALNIAILIWFSYLFYKDCVLSKTCYLHRPMGLPAMLGISVMVVGVLSGLMLNGFEYGSETEVHHHHGAESGNPFSISEGSSPVGTGSKSDSEMACGGAMKPSAETSRRSAH